MKGVFKKDEKITKGGSFLFSYLAGYLKKTKGVYLLRICDLCLGAKQPNNLSPYLLKGHTEILHWEHRGKVALLKSVFGLM